MTKQHQEQLHLIREILDAGQYKDALPILREQVAHNPTDRDLLMLLAECLYDLEDYAETVRFAAEILESDADNLFVLNIVAGAYLSLNEPHQALYYAKRAVCVGETLLPHAMDNALPRIEFNIALVQCWSAFDDIGEHENALAIARRGVNETETTGYWTGKILSSLVSLGLLEDAERLCGYEPLAYRNVLVNIGFQLAYLKQYDCAARYFLRHLSFLSLPTHIISLLPYIECIASMKKYDEVIALSSYWLFEKKIRNSRAVIALNMLLIHAYMMTAQTEMATERFRSCRKISSCKNMSKLVYSVITRP